MVEAPVAVTQFHEAEMGRAITEIMSAAITIKDVSLKVFFIIFLLENNLVVTFDKICSIIPFRLLHVTKSTLFYHKKGVLSID